jgi:hypothetical protein
MHIDYTCMRILLDKIWYLFGLSVCVFPWTLIKCKHFTPVKSLVCFAAMTEKLNLRYHL